MKKFLVCIVALIACFLLTTCGERSEGEYKNDYFKRNQTKVLTISWMEDGVVIDTDNKPTLQAAKELTNIELKNVLAKSTTDWQPALNLLVTSGKEPDIMHMYNREIFLRYARNGVLRPLDDLIEKYAPNIKRHFEEHPDQLTRLKASDGKLYYIPCFADGEVSNSWFIRSDWLNKLGLSEPTSVEEYYNVLKAFKTRDPNGNGKNDEIPYFNRNAGINYEQSVNCLFVLWNTAPSIMEKDGRIVFGPCEPEFRAAIENIAKWYKEGLIDPEIYTRGRNAREQLLGNNVGGSTYDWIGTTAQFNDTLKDKIKDFEFIPVPPPSGRVYDSRATIKDVGWAISAKSENSVDAIRYMDFWFSHEGWLLANYGIEGITYDMVDGKPILKDSIKNQEQPIVAILNEYGAQLNMGYQQDFEYERQWLSPIALQGIDMYKNNNYIKPLTPSIPLTEEQKQRITELLPTISNYVSYTQQHWILGAKDISSTYDEFLTTLKKMYVEELVEIYQAAYDASK